MWLTWRQYRVPIVVASVGLVALALVLVITGPSLVHLYNSTVAHCKVQNDCSSARASFLQNDASLLAWLGAIVTVAPGLMGVFWGAPLIARELETGTYRLAWTQSVTRMRWLALKLAVVGVASMVVAGLLSLMVTWWASPLDQVTMNPFGSFAQRDIVPIAYAAFALALGVTTGVLIRRTVPAMAATVVGFTAARVAVLEWVRPNLAAPMHLTASDSFYINLLPPAGNLNPRDWVTSNETLNGAGKVIGQNGMVGNGINVTLKGHRMIIAGVGSCPNVTVPVPAVPAEGPGKAGHLLVQQCLDKLGVHDLLSYQPISRYWAFQWYEFAIFLALTVIMVGLCFWLVRRHLA
ncbi:MAG: ABC transporter permease subunit [Candidatus Dormibacteria bacterium]